MMQKQFIPFLMRMTLALALSVSFACDRVNTNPAVLASTNVVVEFSAESSTIQVGEGTVLHWAISDPDGVAESINFHGGGEDRLINLTGSKGVSPQESTVYYIDVLNANNKVVKSSQVKVQVFGDDGKEVTAAGSVSDSEVEVLCQDLNDNDQDGLVDCADSDCTADAACVVEEVPTENTASFTTPPAYSFSGSTLCVGDSITVTWASNFEYVQVSVLSSGSSSGFYGEQAAQGSYEVTNIPAEETEIQLTGYMGSQVVSTETLSVITSGEEACADPVFDGSFSGGVYPSNNLIQGEPYVLYWSSDDLSAVELDGVNVRLEQDRDEADTLSAKNKIHRFTLWDDQSPSMSDERTISVKASSFDVNAQSALSAGVSHVIAGANASEVYLLSGKKVIKATNYLSAFETVVDGATLNVTETDGTTAVGIAEDLVGFAKTASGKYYLATVHYVYFVDGTAAKPLLKMTYGAPADFEFTFVHTEGDKALVGSNAVLVKFDPNASCSETEKVQGQCCSQIDVGGEKIGHCRQALQDTVNYRAIFKKGFTSDDLYLVTDDVVYKSKNNDFGFSEYQSGSGLSSLHGGSWAGSSGGYVWNSSSVYDHNDDTRRFEAVDGLTESMTGGAIYYVNSYAGRLFVATANGVYIKNAVGWSAEPVLSEAVRYVVFKNNLGTMSGKVSLHDMQYTATVVTDSGSTASVNYKYSFTGNLRLTSPTSFTMPVLSR